MTNYRYTISLRVIHPDYDPDYISSALHMEPKYKWKAKTQRTSPNGQAVEGIYEDTRCTYVLKHNDIDIFEFISEYNKKLIIHASFIEKLKMSGGRVEYFIGIFLQDDIGFFVQSDYIKELSKIGVDLAVCVYLPDKAESYDAML